MVDHGVMKIAFVGKGGAGKTTTSSLFAQHVSYTHPVLAIDADINMHMAELLKVTGNPASMMISERQPSSELKKHLKGTNERIASIDHFKKSTPPGAGSNLINISDENDWFMNRFSRVSSPTLSLATVGTYSEEGIASSCYHNNLAILENTLSHMTDDGIAVVDMVAGTDAFASTLFAQFDVLFFVAEPTARSLAVFDQYKALATKGDVLDRLYVVGNKIDDIDDEEFIRKAVGDRYVASISRSSQILNVDKGRASLDASSMSGADIAALNKIELVAREHATSAQSRLELLWKLHKVYVQQSYIIERFGDLTAQIDPSFKYPSAAHE